MVPYSDSLSKLGFPFIVFIKNNNWYIWIYLPANKIIANRYKFKPRQHN